MHHFVFGVLPKKKLEVTDDGVVTIKGKLTKDTDCQAQDIETLFYKEPTRYENGYMYLSLNGQLPRDVILEKRTLVLTRKQEQSAQEFIALLESHNDELTVQRTLKGLTERNTPPKKDKHAVKCPKCKSINVVFMDNKRKGFSVGKAVAGGALTGGVGTLAGFAGKKGKDRWHCQDCGHTFEKK